MKKSTIIIVGVIVTIINFCIVFAVIAGYSISLAIQAQGAPDTAQIDAFANQIGPIASLVLAVLLTFVASLWMTRRSETAESTDGLIIGVVAAILGLIVGLISNGFSALLVVTFLLTIGAGWLGGALRTRKATT